MAFLFVIVISLLVTLMFKICFLVVLTLLIFFFIYLRLTVAIIVLSAINELARWLQLTVFVMRLIRTDRVYLLLNHFLGDFENIRFPIFGIFYIDRARSHQISHTIIVSRELETFILRIWDIVFERVNFLEVLLLVFFIFCDELMKICFLVWISDFSRYHFLRLTRLRILLEKRVF